ncbi:hypothetical protein [Halomonas sp. BC2]|uniref:hypothetical protein n=1 Tax=Halomonadaceae TaxID=28256 RepID=UPI001118889D|nr:hypothetical protein [Halomonas sp. BC2]
MAFPPALKSKKRPSQPLSRGLPGRRCHRGTSRAVLISGLLRLALFDAISHCADYGQMCCNEPLLVVTWSTASIGPIFQKTHKYQQKHKPKETASHILCLHNTPASLSLVQNHSTRHQTSAAMAHITANGAAIDDVKQLILKNYTSPAIGWPIFCCC